MAWNLVGDIGGTNMRLAAEEDGKIIRQQTLPTVGDVSIADALAEFCRSSGQSPINIAIAAAGIVDQGKVVLTNTGTVITEAKIAAACGTPKSTILNDFEAAAWSLANVDGDDLTCLQGNKILLEKPRVIIGPGTGLGVGALVYRGTDPVVVQGEGGHVRLSPDTHEELAIFKALGELWPVVRMGEGQAVEAEAVLSGTGLPYFYKAIANVLGMHVEPKKSGDIFESAKAKSDSVAEKAVTYFTKYLGEIAGDMGVTFSAKGGVFLTGGVIASNKWIFDSPVFLNAFNSGGRHSAFRKTLPIFINNNSNFGLNGATNYLRFTV